jgi:chromosome partitioning protein
VLLTIGGLKGGLGKSTTAWFLGAGLARTGPTLLVDADPASQSLFGWASQAIEAGHELPFEVQPWSTLDLGRKIRAIGDRYEHIVIDTGGETSRLFAISCAVTHDLLVPVGPYRAELERLPATFEAARQVEEETGDPVYPRILLVKVDRRTLNGPQAREYLAGAGLPVMAAEVRFSVPDYARAPGFVPDELGDYQAVLDELLAADAAAAEAAAGAAT